MAKQRRRPEGALACVVFACAAVASGGRVGVEKLGPLDNGGSDPGSGGASRAGSPGTGGATRIVWDEGQFAAVPTSQGYDVEVFIVAADLGLDSWSLEAGDEVGLDLAHDVSVPPGQPGAWGNRDSQYFLRILEPPTGDGNDLPFLNENAFCTATLLAPQVSRLRARKQTTPQP